MLVIKTIEEISHHIQGLKGSGKVIGFVPTMGALHQGHLSLIQAANRQADITVASIFVNPTQFNNPDDLKNYPRTFTRDLELLEKAGCDIVFAPSENEMYPKKDERTFDFGELDKVMEGEHRPGHFNGVGLIVSKLFDAVQPHKAFFGEKDFQQVAVVKKLVQLLNQNVEIIPCPTIRESDGLAMSSRNKLLSPQHRKAAPIIYETLAQAKLLTNTMAVNELKTFVKDKINQHKLLKVEYFELVNGTTLEAVSDFNNGKVIVGCIAVWAGNVRLIDNIIF